MLPTMTALPTITVPLDTGLPNRGSERDVTLVPVRAGLWRVAHPSGAILGQIEAQTDADGERFAARRLVRSTRMLELGRFCRLADATDCFR